MSSSIVNSPQLVVTTALAGPLSGGPGGSASPGFAGGASTSVHPSGRSDCLAVGVVVAAAAGEAEGEQRQRWPQAGPGRRKRS